MKISGIEIDVKPPVSYQEIVHILRIETDDLEKCKAKTIRVRKGLKGLFRTETKIVHMNDIFETIDYWEM